MIDHEVAERKIKIAGFPCPVEPCEDFVTTVKAKLLLELVLLSDKHQREVNKMKIGYQPQAQSNNAQSS